VLVLYAAWIGWARHLGHDWRHWADVGRQFAQRDAASESIRADTRFSVSTWGYDGQFFLYIAQDPAGAHDAITIRRRCWGGLNRIPNPSMPANQTR
jgi:hypothetical protein